ncbi:MAG: 50S ribosomal protein L32 [Bacteroidales bacterium]|nr:50S ribosomal protein L32 [Bacteroidales bacterium]MCR5713865.1 50S ribosomal protein L32 [Bacteroidales bacterium]
MPNPKRRHSKQRRDKRRANDHALVPTTAKCPNCNATVLYHRVCPSCGFYRGKLAIEKNAAE